MTLGTQGLHPAWTDAQAVKPECLCRRCGGELYPGETSYLWNGSQVCTDCFQMAVTVWVCEAAQEAAQALGVETQVV